MGNQSQNGYPDPPLQYDIVGAADTRKLQTDTLKIPFRYICQIETRLSDGNTYVGTGFFIGPKTILTAGHVIWDQFQDRKLSIGNVSITPARNGNAKPFGVFQPTNIIPSYPGYSSGDFSTRKDYAIIHINGNIGLTAGYFGRGKWSKDTYGSRIIPTRNLPLPPNQLKVNLSGYPVDKGGTTQYSSFNLGFTMQETGGIMTYLNDTFGGHSGSPVWIKRDPAYGGRVLVGIHIAHGPESKLGEGVEYNKAVFISEEVKRFIRRNKK